MRIIKNSITLCLVLFAFFKGSAQDHAYAINNNIKAKTVTFGNSKVQFKLDYDGKAVITAMNINGEKVLDETEGMFSEIKTSAATLSTLHTISSPQVEVMGNTIKVGGINYGNDQLRISENWKFTITNTNIVFNVDRNFSNAALVEEASLPKVMFKSINTWEGAFQSFGGVAWFYLFNQKLCTYGVHSNSARFWNSKTGNGLSVTVDAPGNQVAMKYSRTNQDQLAYAVTVSKDTMGFRLDSGTYRKRFIRQRTDVWAPFNIAAGNTSQNITFSYFDFNQEFGRGKFVGLDGTQVNSILNTVARIGVIDADHFGGNSWHTPYGPICLHEQYIAQMGLAINDNTYLQGYQSCLDFYRDNAVKPDGRVYPRWAYDNSDAMPGQFTGKGFYEAQWGYLLDSNPDFVTNVAELYDQTGNTKWVKTQQAVCEKALDWIINRDSNGNGLVEMINDTHQQQKSSDWIDIVWASFENAFVNANLYHALIKWAAIEQQLGNTTKAQFYAGFAAKLKANFNKSTTQGGFWDEQKGCYVHWLDKDGSAHGNNMVTPVNFMAIAYGICDDVNRQKIILDGIENQMQKENLFFWPLAMTSYAPGEARDVQYPFPEYENGDLFLSWGSVAVAAYANYKPAIALKYVKKVMERYSRDGLAFQRYGRLKQDGRGDDILAGNCLSVVGLYQAVYGINPLYNRFYLNPHITAELSGTQLNYNYRDQKLTIDLDAGKYSISGGRYKITAKHDFGFYNTGNELSYFDGTSAIPSLVVKTQSENMLALNIKNWTQKQIVLTQTCACKTDESLSYRFSVTSNTVFKITINGNYIGRFKSDAAGVLIFNYKALPIASIILSGV